MDGVERVLQAHLRAGDRIAVEDPGYAGVLDLVGAMGLVPQPVPLDDFGVRPEALAVGAGRRARARSSSPRAPRTRPAPPSTRSGPAPCARVLDRHPDVLLIEDDHAGPVAGTPALTLAHPRKPRWAVVRSVSKSLGPDLRLALLAGDATTVARVEGRQALGAGWVSHVLQGAVASLWTNAATDRRLRDAAQSYTRRRRALVEALAPPRPGRARTIGVQRLGPRARRGGDHRGHGGRGMGDPGRGALPHPEPARRPHHDQLAHAGRGPARGGGAGGDASRADARRGVALGPARRGP